MTGMAKASKLHKNPGYKKCIIPQKYKKPWYCFGNGFASGLNHHIGQCNFDPCQKPLIYSLPNFLPPWRTFLVISLSSDLLVKKSFAKRVGF